MKAHKLIILFILSISISACANPSIVNVDKNAVSNIAFQSIYIPRFEGNPDFVEESTDYFIFNLKSKTNISIIQGDAIRVEGTDIHSGGNLSPKTLAIDIAKKHNADAVIMGKVTSHHTLDSLNGFSTVRLISAKTGSIIANFHRPSGMLFGYSEHQAVLSAVKRTAEDVANAINAK